jgi:hypothetical protein
MLVMAGYNVAGCVMVKEVWTTVAVLVTFTV